MSTIEDCAILGETRCFVSERLIQHAVNGLFILAGRHEIKTEINPRLRLNGVSASHSTR